MKPIFFISRIYIGLCFVQQEAHGLTKASKGLGPKASGGAPDRSRQELWCDREAEGIPKLKPAPRQISAARTKTVPKDRRGSRLAGNPLPEPERCSPCRVAACRRTASRTHRGPAASAGPTHRSMSANIGRRTVLVCMDPAEAPPRAVRPQANLQFPGSAGNWA
jgi:hypothetical protein